MKYFDNKAEKIWYDYVISNCKKIKVTSGKCRFNFRCHNNVVHDAIRNKDKKIALVFYKDVRGVILHLINYRNKKYIDNTLGEWSNFHDYYFIRWIEKNQFNFDTLDIFDITRKQYTKMIPLSWRWLVNTTI